MDAVYNASKLRERVSAQEKAAKEAFKLRRRAEQRGAPASVQSQREWVKANPAASS